MLNSARRSLDFAARLVALAAAVGGGTAAAVWQKSHPRWEQVRHRAVEPSPRAATVPGGGIENPAGYSIGEMSREEPVIFALHDGIALTGPSLEAAPVQHCDASA